MITNDRLKDAILKEIAKSYPFSIDDVKFTYKTVSSFDATIQCCETACRLGINLHALIDFLKVNQKTHNLPRNSI